MGPCDPIKEQDQDKETETTDQEAVSDQDNDEGDDEENNYRKKRDTMEQMMKQKYPANITFSINCSDPSKFECMTLKCYIGPGLQKNNVETIYLNVTADFSALGKEKMKLRRKYFNNYFTEKRLGSKTHIQINSISTVSIKKPQDVFPPEIKRLNIFI